MKKQSSPQMTGRETLIQAFKFLLFSTSAGIIQVLVFSLLNEVVHLDKYTSLDELLGSQYGLSYFIALVCSVLWNFTFNRRFTFKSAANVPIAMLKIFGYYCVFTPLSVWWGGALTVLGWNEYIVLGGTMIINLITEYLFCRFVVYRSSMNTNAAAQKSMEGSKGLKTKN